MIGHCARPPGQDAIDDGEIAGGLGGVGPRPPANERHRRQHPAESGDHVVDHHDHAVGLDQRRLCERHREERPHRHQNDQQDRTDELAQADGHVFRSIAGTVARRYGPQRSYHDGEVCKPLPHVCVQTSQSKEHWQTHTSRVVVGMGGPLRARCNLVGTLHLRCRQTNDPMTSLAPSTDTRRRAVRLWLLAVAALMFATVVVGGATRLTESGLSIVEWKPVTGVVPPLDATAWQVEFDKYKTIPQYREHNAGMSLDEFKIIYWWEWTHRLLARLVGAAFLIPFLWF